MSDYPGLGFLLNDIARLMRVSFERKAGPVGLTRAQWSLLAHLKEHEGINQAGLAQLLEIDPVTVTRLVDRLVAAGLVARCPCPTDRRVHRLYLTDAARPYLEQMAEIAARVRREALEGVGAEDLARFVRVATRIKANLSQARARHSACGSARSE